MISADALYQIVGLYTWHACGVILAYAAFLGFGSRFRGH